MRLMLQQWLLVLLMVMMGEDWRHWTNGDTVCSQQTSSMVIGQRTAYQPHHNTFM